uniref:Uncharacterized protein n=1 Tax=Panagrolaimus sp. ES5 TaxID=591445 RepID=A0AC34F274_9BILA
MNRFPRFLLLQKSNVFAARGNTSNTILDNIKDGVKQTIDAVNDTAKHLSQTTVKLSSQGIEIKNPAMEKMKKDDKEAPREVHREIKHEQELKAASKTAHDIDEIDRLLNEKKNTF